MSKPSSQSKLEREAHLRWVPLGKVRVSPVAQRELKQYRVDRILADFRFEDLGNPTVSDRDGCFFIIDGQHRIAALREWLGEGWEVQQVQCWVYTGLTEAEEADKFDRLNDVLTVSAFDRFTKRVTAGRPVECEVDRIVRSQHLVVSRDDVPGAIGAAATLCKVWTRSDSATLGRTLRIIRDSFGDAGLEAKVIDGIGHFCQRYNGQVDEQSVIDKLSKTHGGVSGLASQAEVLHKATGNPRSHCVAAAAVDIYNKGQRKKLPNWWAS